MTPRPSDNRVIGGRVIRVHFVQDRARSPESTTRVQLYTPMRVPLHKVKLDVDLDSCTPRGSVARDSN